MITIRSVCIVLAIAFVFVGCGSLPDRKKLVAPGMQDKTPTGKSYSKNMGKSAMSIAQQVIGSPYRFGGSTPKGFDCSGLVYYSYKKAGMKVSRTTALSLYNNAKHIKKSELYLGDLVFFKLTGSRTSHVGIYSGSNRFIHAPSTGKKVMVSSLSDPYWRKRYIGGGRFMSD